MVRKVSTVVACCVLLSGCVTLQAVGVQICKNQEAARASLLLALQSTDSPAKRAAIQASLRALEECPQP